MPFREFGGGSARICPSRLWLQPRHVNSRYISKKRKFRPPDSDTRLFIPTHAAPNTTIIHYCMQTMATLSSIRSLTLDLPPSCIQFCPGKPHLFVVGTYFLHAAPSSEVEASTSPNEKIEARKAVQKRTGSLVLYELSPENIM